MFNRAAMTMSQNATGAWKVDSIDITRPGNLVFEMSNKPPRATDFKGLPLGKPFSCDPPQSRSDNNGSMVTKLVFATGSVVAWHDSLTEPFDSIPNRTVQLTMTVLAAGVQREEPLFVTLSCAAMPHAQPPKSILRLLAHVAATVITALVFFFKNLFVAKQHRLAAEEQPELAADGPEGVGKELHD